MANDSQPTVLRKRHNLTAWILQILACLAYIGIGVFEIIRTTAYHPYIRSDYAVNIVTVIVIAIATFTIAVVEIVFFAKQNLSPVLMLILSSVTTALWGLQFLVSVIAGAATGSLTSLIIYLPISAIVLGTTISQVVISAKMMRSEQRQTAAPLSKYES